VNYADNEILLYDLGNRPASFDFVTCCATAMALGCKHVRFVYGNWKPKNYSIKQAEERWLSIVEPAAALYGLTYSIGERKGLEISHMLRAAIDTYRHTGKIGKIKWPVTHKDYVTLTMRKSRTPERDSKEDEWREFARRCDRKVIWIADNEDSSLHLHDRMTLYANAFVNIMVINGPVTLCVHSDAPYICMRTIGCEKSGSTSPKFMAGNGITPGFQFPWANENQRMSYLDDTVANIEFEYAAFQERKRIAA